MIEGIKKIKQSSIDAVCKLPSSRVFPLMDMQHVDIDIDAVGQ